MKKGETINGYYIIGVEGKDFSTKGGGLSKWTFAKKDGADYFMKEFLSPKFPDEKYPGSPELKAKKKLECEEFVRQHQVLINAINKYVTNTCTLVHTIDFFLSGAKYYKITRRVEVSEISIVQIANLQIEKKIFLLKTLSESLSILHNAGIVHGDLKPDNILIKEITNNYYTSNLIDYDNCYFASNPPPLDKLVGDLPYYSPELANYALGLSSASILTQKSDIFALGLLFCQYLTGRVPSAIPNDKYASSIVNDGVIIQINTSNLLPSELVKLINLMLLKNPASRPDINQILLTLNKIPERNIVQKGRLIINLGAKKL